MYSHPVTNAKLKLKLTTGPAHPWLVQAYAEVIPYPCGSIMGQELFQTGVIPSDTDYRIFKEFGGELPGNIRPV